jgi:TfoX/Sxy family transcriptional regulator of competence genes
MTYDADLAERVRRVLAGEPGVTEKRMFGGLAFLLDGHMAVGASGQGGLMVRIDPADTDDLVDPPHARPFEMRGRAVTGWLRVDDEPLTSEEELRRWVERGIAFARTLPPK